MMKHVSKEASNVILNNGVELPRIGLGTFRSQGQDVKVAVHAALAAGLRHIDTAAIYKVNYCLGSNCCRLLEKTFESYNIDQRTLTSSNLTYFRMKSK